MFSFGVIVIAVGTDLTGRIYEFLCGEWPHVCVGLVAFAFSLIVAIINSHLQNTQKQFEKEVEKKLAEYGQSLSYVTFEKCSMKDEIEFMRKSLEKHWGLCEDTIEKAAEALKPKPPIAIESPAEATQPTSQPLQQIEASVVQAVQELVGGAV